MGIYSTRGIYESSVDLDAVETEEIFEENFTEAALRHTYEATCNLNNIMKSVGVLELSVFEETGEEMVYEAGAISGFFAKIKAAIMKIWQKIKSLFTKFFAKMQSFGKDDKAFINKYKKELLKADMKDFEYKGYEFTIDKLKAKEVEDNMKSIAAVKLAYGYGESASTNYGDGFEPKQIFGDKDTSDILESVRAKAIASKSSTLDQSEFTKELFETFRNGESNKETLDTKNKALDRGLIINFLVNSSTSEKGIKDDYKGIEKSINEIIKKLDKAENENSKIAKDDDNAKINKQTNVLGVIRKSNEIVTGCLTIIEQVEAAKMTAFNDRRKQCKAICVKLLGRKAKNESYYEDDYGYEGYSENFSSFLDDVKLV